MLPYTDDARSGVTTSAKPTYLLLLPMKNGLCGKEVPALAPGPMQHYMRASLILDEVTSTSFYNTYGDNMNWLIYESAAFNEGWSAFWTAKKRSECPYVGQKQDQWYAGYAAAEAADIPEKDTSKWEFYSISK